MRILAEMVSVMAGVTVIATYLGWNAKRWMRAKRDRLLRKPPEGRDK